MNAKYENYQKLSQKFQSVLRIYIDMLGELDPSKETQYGFLPGLQITSDVNLLQNELNKMEEGIFQVLFTGIFSTGKSTMINALIGKDLLHKSINPETAVITRIVFGKEEKVKVYKKNVVNKETGETEVEILSIEEFFEKYHVDNENPAKFSNVKYVDLFQSEDGIGGTLVQLVDSPGTNASTEDTLTARTFAKEANAIVYMICALTPFQQDDNKYIADHFAGKHMKNVFFVVNQYDRLNEEEKEKVRERAKDCLREVFIDENGKFDEELYNKRVFFTDAYHSLCARTGVKVQTPSGEMDCVDSITHVPDFEDNLTEFLTNDDRDILAFQGRMPQLASKYVHASDAIDKRLEIYEKNVDQLEKEKVNFENTKKILDDILDQTRLSCENCVKAIVLNSKEEYQSCLKRIDAGWDNYFQNTEIPFNIRDFIKTQWYRGNEEKIKELTKPFMDEVAKYITPQYEILTQNLTNIVITETESFMKTMEISRKQIQQLELPFDIELIEVFPVDPIQYPDFDPSKSFNDPKWLAVILGVLFGDPDIVLDGLGGNKSNAELVKDSLSKNLLEIIGWNIWWPIGVAILYMRLRQMFDDMDDATRNRAAIILMSYKKEFINNLQNNLERFTVEIEDRISEITRACNQFIEIINNKTEDYEKSLEQIIKDINDNKNAKEAEKERTDQIKATLLKEISDVNELLTGKTLSDAEVKAMGVK